MPLELRLMRSLAERFSDESSKPWVSFTHAERGPWSRIRDSGRGFIAHIPYALAIPDHDEYAKAVCEWADEHVAARNALGNST